MPRALSFFQLKMHYPSLEVANSDEMHQFEAMVAEIVEENPELAFAIPSGKARAFVRPEPPHERWCRLSTRGLGGKTRKAKLAGRVTSVALVLRHV